MRRAPKARNIIARGKRRAERGASPLVRQISMKRALKVRHMIDDYSALSELHAHYVCGPGATRLAPLGACPWLSYFAPLALRILNCDFLCKARCFEQKLLVLRFLCATSVF